MFGLGVRLLQSSQTAWLPGIYAVLQPHAGFCANWHDDLVAAELSTIRMLV